MRTGIDILFDEAEARGFVKAASRLVESGLSIHEASMKPLTYWI